MAIKRSSKSRGTPARKPVVSAAMHHVDVRPQQQMVGGESYVGWLCKNKACGLVIAIASAPSGSKPALADSADQLTALKCPHCGNEDLYRWSNRNEHQYVPKGAPS